MSSYTKSDHPSEHPLTDDQLLDKARKAKNHGAKFLALFDDGAWREAGFKTRSSADRWLTHRLAYWFGPDPERVDALYRRSAMYEPTQWDKVQGRGT